MLRKMSRAFIVVTAISLSGCSLLAPFKPGALPEVSQSGLPTTQLLINGVALIVEVARTDAARAQGLSDRESMPANAGMLFIFDKPGRYEFWMNRMNFPLDFIWLNQGKVMEISQNIPAPSLAKPRPVTLTPSVAIDAVIEVNAGWTQEHGVSLGQTVEGLTGFGQ